MAAPPLAGRVRRAQIRIASLTVALLLLALGLTAALLLARYRAELIRRSDERLSQATAQIPLVAGDLGNLPSNADVASSVQVLDAEGTVVYSTGLVADQPALWRAGEPRQPHGVETAQSGSFRVAVTSLGDLDVDLVLVEPLAPIEESVAALRNMMLISLVPLAGVVGAIVWLAVGRSLRPVTAAVEREEQLIADVSHELRSPLAGMRVLLETEPSDGVDLAENRAEVLGQVDRLQAITQQLLAVAQPGALSAPVRPIDLDEVVQRAVRSLAQQTTCTIDTTAVQPAQIIGVERDMDSIVTNLLENATRHATATVTVKVCEDDTWGFLVVSDDGPGIAKGQRRAAFERFTRLDDSRSRNEGGTGLGLAIVKTTVDAHDGRIEISDTPGGGATFTVRLPRSILT